MCAESLQLRPTLWDPINCRGPTVYGPARFLCPWDSPGKNTVVGCHALLQGIVPTQESNLCLLCLLLWQTGSLPLAPPRKPCNVFVFSLKPEGDQFPGLTHYLSTASILALCLFPGGFCRFLSPAAFVWTFEVSSRPVRLSLVTASGYSVIRYPKF